MKKTSTSEQTTHCKKRGSFFGVLLIVLGVVLLMNTFGIFEHFVFNAYKTFWPIGLIIAGVFFIIRWKGTGHLFLALTIVLGIMFLFSGQSLDDVEQHEYEQEVPLEYGVQYGEIRLEYGAGEISLGKGDELYKNIIETSDTHEPKMNVERSGDTISIDVSREARPMALRSIMDSWDISLSPYVIYDLDIDYGAAKFEMDLRGLQMRSVIIETGASDSLIIFGSYPTEVEITTGASSIEFEFPSDMHVMVDYSGGASSVDLDDFYKRDGVYYSDGFDVDAENVIKINIDAGASSISGSWYAVVADVVEEVPSSDEAHSSIGLDIVNSTNISQQI